MGKSKQNKQKTWEEKLEMLLSDNDCNCFVVNKDLKSFISQLLAQQRKELIEEILKIVDRLEPGVFGKGDLHSKVVDLLKSKE